MSTTETPGPLISIWKPHCAAMIAPLFCAPETTTQYCVPGARASVLKLYESESCMHGETDANEPGRQLPSPLNTTALTSLSIPAISGQLMEVICTLTGPPTLLVVKVYQTRLAVAAQKPGQPTAPVLFPYVVCSAQSSAALEQSSLGGCAQHAVAVSSERTRNAMGRMGTERCGRAYARTATPKVAGGLPAPSLQRAAFSHTMLLRPHTLF